MARESRLVIRVKRLHPDARLPQYAHLGHTGDLGADLFSVRTVNLSVGATVSIPTGIAIEPPHGFGAIIQDRSGLAVKGLTTLAGVIDPGFRGEIKIIMTNLSGESASITKGDRIAQLRLVRLFQAEFEEVDELSFSERLDHGFGSTGK